MFPAIPNAAHKKNRSGELLSSGRKRTCFYCCSLLLLGFIQTDSLRLIHSRNERLLGPGVRVFFDQVGNYIIDGLINSIAGWAEDAHPGHDNTSSFHSKLLC